MKNNNMNYEELVEYISKDIYLIFKIKNMINNLFEFEIKNQSSFIDSSKSHQIEFTEDDKNIFLEIYNSFINSLLRNEGIFILFEYIEMTYYNRIKYKEELKLCDIIYLMYVIGNREEILEKDLIFFKNKIERNRVKIYSFIMKLNKKIEKLYILNI
jgi:hypothetical protein